jgi:hypothetical protein
MVGTVYCSGQSTGGLLQSNTVSTTSPDEKPAIPCCEFDAPTAIDSYTLPGLPLEPSPLLPADAITTVPASCAFRIGLMNWS